MSTNNDFIVRNGLQVISNLVVGTYATNNTPVLNGAIISGNVGIGTPTPTAKLDVSGNVILRNNLTVQNSATVSGDMYVNGNLILGNISSLFTTQPTIGLFGNLVLFSDYETTSATTGTLIVTGGISSSSNLYVAGSGWFGNVSINNTIPSTSTTSGALIIDGGVGIGGNIYSNGTVTASSINVLQSTSGNQYTLSLKGYGTGDQFTFTTSSLTGQNGLTSINSTGTTYAPLTLTSSQITISTQNGGTSMVVASSGNVNIVSTATSTSATTGALTVAGGIGVGGNIYVVGSSTLIGNVTITGNLLVSGNYTVFNTQALSVLDPIIDIGTGLNNTQLISNDGKDRGIIFHYWDTTGIGDNHAVLFKESNNGPLTYVTNVQPGITNVTSPILANSTGYAWGSFTLGNIDLRSNIGTTSSSTGALQVDGGIGVAGNIYASGAGWYGNISVMNTTVSTSTTSGALVVAGGVGVVGNVYVGNINVAAGSTSMAPINLTAGTLKTTATPGSIEYDGEIFYGTPLGTQRGVIPTTQFYQLGTYRTLPLVAQPSVSSLFGVNVAVSGGTKYAYEIVAVVSRTTGTSQSTQYSLAAATGVLTDHFYVVHSSISTSNTAIGTTSSLSANLTANFGTPVVVTTALAAATFTRIRIDGTIGVTTSGTIQPQISLNGGTPTIYNVIPGSYMRIWPIASTTTGNIAIGSWTAS